MKEIYKNIPGYDGLYQVSNLGNVKSLKWGKERILKASLGSGGYLSVCLRKNKKKKTYRVHQLCAMVYLGHVPNRHKAVVNHIDNNPLNNHVDNLEVISQRENTSIHKTDIGVCWHKRDKKWMASIRIGVKVIHLGCFTDKQQGLNKYQLALENMNLYNGDAKQFRNILTL